MEDAGAPIPARPAPQSWGTKALKTLAACTVAGFPLLLAFGLGVLVWIYGVVAAILLALAGLRKDSDKTRSVVALALALTMVLLAYLNGRR